jgi:hypothetical protein
MTKEWKYCKKWDPVGMEQSNSIFYADYQVRAEFENE